MNFSFTYPKHWVPMGEDENVKVVELARSDPDWSRIGDRVSESLPNFRVVRMRRIQHKPLWRLYQTGKLLLATRLGRPYSEALDLNEKELFHGTHNPDPIFDEAGGGFDFRICRGGAYGKGAYFAQHAAYPVFVHPRAAKQNGAYELFVARVALGTPRDYKNACKGDLIRPPIESDGKNKKALYDSATGTEGNLRWFKHHDPEIQAKIRNSGSFYGKQYIVYANNQSYPSLLVEIQQLPVLEMFSLPMMWTKEKGPILANNGKGDRRHPREFEYPVAFEGPPEICSWLSWIDVGCHNHHGRIHVESKTSNSKATVECATWLDSQVHGAEVTSLAYRKTGKLAHRRVFLPERLEEKGVVGSEASIHEDGKAMADQRAIFVATRKLDWDHRRNLRFNLTHTDGCKLFFSKWADTVLFSVCAMVITSSLPLSKLQAGEIRFDHAQFKEKAWEKDEWGGKWKAFNVRFAPAFKEKPKVACGFSALDCRGSSARLKVTPSNITKEGFDVVVGTWADTEIFWCKPTWIAHEGQLAAL